MQENRIHPLKIPTRQKKKKNGHFNWELIFNHSYFSKRLNSILRLGTRPIPHIYIEKIYIYIYIALRQSFVKLSYLITRKSDHSIDISIWNGEKYYTFHWGDHSKVYAISWKETIRTQKNFSSYFELFGEWKWYLWLSWWRSMEGPGRSKWTPLANTWEAKGTVVLSAVARLPPLATPP